MSHTESVPRRPGTTEHVRIQSYYSETDRMAEPHYRMYLHDPIPRCFSISGRYPYLRCLELATQSRRISFAAHCGKEKIRILRESLETYFWHFWHTTAGLAGILPLSARGLGASPYTTTALLCDLWPILAPEAAAAIYTLLLFV